MRGFTSNDRFYTSMNYLSYLLVIITINNTVGFLDAYLLCIVLLFLMSVIIEGIEALDLKAGGIKWKLPFMT